MLCDYEECSLLGCDAVWLLLEGKYRHHHDGGDTFLETLVLTKATRRNIPEISNLQFFTAFVVLEELLERKVAAPV
jgi:hypothetical protein